MIYHTELPIIPIKLLNQIRNFLYHTKSNLKFSFLEHVEFCDKLITNVNLILQSQKFYSEIEFQEKLACIFVNTILAHDLNNEIFDAEKIVDCLKDLSGQLEFISTQTDILNLANEQMSENIELKEYIIGRIGALIKDIKNADPKMYGETFANVEFNKLFFGKSYNRRILQDAALYRHKYLQGTQDEWVLTEPSSSSSSAYR